MQHHMLRRLLISKPSQRCGLLQLQVCTIRRNTSTATEPTDEHIEVEQPQPQRLQFCEHAPDQHTRSHQHQIYSIDKSLTNGRLARAVPKHFAHLSKAINATSLLIRQPALECIAKMQQAEEEEVPVKILLNGPTGGGKSLTLLQVLHYGILKNMVILYVPNPYRFVDDNVGALLKSSWKESRFDQPSVAKAWLDTFRSMNMDFLQKTLTTKEYKWGRVDTTPCGKSLLQMLEQGSSRDSYLTDSVGILLREIRLNKDANVLYAVDACNGLFSPTSSHGDPKNLALVEMFTKLLQPEFSLNRGAYVFATSQTVQYLKHPPRVGNPSPLELIFDQNTLSRFSDFLDIEVPEYSEYEYELMLDFYHHVGWLARDKSEDLVKQVDFIARRNPHAVQQIIRSL